ncbi:hypothetical protein PR048_008471 [Dryococelus australis]|uniref:ABC transmembrane type-1 domain-containing protein n=1 Tax=Dryococelus australis TaxID=614101 RepID=A0ABQ9HX73_9NEOP|nr:hypothetical protein PR048_008471 [Dryococelus australis]
MTVETMNVCISILYALVMYSCEESYRGIIIIFVGRDSDAKATFRKASESISFRGGKQQKAVRLSLLGPLLKAFGSTFLFSISLRLTQDLLAFVNPQILRSMIAFVESDDPDWKGYMYAALMLVCGTIQTFFQAHYFIKAQTAGMRVRCAVISAIYRKVMCRTMHSLCSVCSILQLLCHYIISCMANFVSLPASPHECTQWMFSRMLQDGCLTEFQHVCDILANKVE